VAAARFRTLISVEELSASLNEGADLQIFDCRFSLSDRGAGRALYEQEHLPGAWYADLEGDLSGRMIAGRTGRHPLPGPHEIGAWLGARGVSHSTQVVAYDEAGGGIAARLWWLTRWLGHDDAAVLDGGIAEWRRAGLPVTDQIPALRSAPFAARPNAALTADAGEVNRARQSDVHRVFDARAPARYRGEIEPIDPIAGHIAGARSLPFEQNLRDGRFLPVGELRARYEAALDGVGATAAIAYCGSGVTACHTVLAATHAGLDGMRLYPGSFSEWICSPEHAVLKG
jgi:thiosulfate/3-mercaptopyruvate sulfurtransferase